ncbi:MAG: chemotaxis protein CheW [Nitrospirota bacterium]
MSLRGRIERAANGPAVKSFLIVTFAGTACALPADIVRGMVEPQTGGMGDRLEFLGRTYPLQALSDRFGLPPSPPTGTARIILCEVRDAARGFLVDEVRGLTDVSLQAVRPLPPHFTGPERQWFPGLFLSQDSVTLLVDPDWLLGHVTEVYPAETVREAETAVPAAAQTDPFEPIQVQVEETGDAEDLPWAEI